MTDTNPLTDCEIDALRLLAGGFTPKQAARRLGITGTAVSMRVARASAKLGTRTAIHHCKGYLARTPEGGAHERGDSHAMRLVPETSDRGGAQVSR